MSPIVIKSSSQAIATSSNYFDLFQYETIENKWPGRDLVTIIDVN